MTEERPRPRPVATVVPAVAPPAAEPPAKPPKGAPPPFLLDFFPLESEKDTRVAAFYAALRDGRLTTTRCRTDSLLLWPPRAVCPKCHTEALEWVDLPMTGRVYAFSAVLAGAPLGMERELPFVVGLVDLDGVPLRLFGRIVGRAWEQCRVGMAVRAEPYSTDDGRVFYRFVAAG